MFVSLDYFHNYFIIKDISMSSIEKKRDDLEGSSQPIE